MRISQRTRAVTPYGQNTIAIVGAPRTGKSTFAQMLASAIGCPLIRADDWCDRPWGDIPGLLGAEIQRVGRAVVEGCQVARLYKRGYQPAATIEMVRAMPTEAKHRGIASMVASALRSVPRITTTLDGALAVWREDKERMQEFLLGQGVGQ